MTKGYKTLLIKTLLVVNCLYPLNNHAQQLEKHRWKHRVLIIKTQSENSKKISAQLSEFKNQKEALKERKIVLYTLVNNRYSLTDFTDSTQNYNEAIRSSFFKKLLDPDKDFEILLIGLDGQVKIKKDKPLSKETLFGLIDAMPMRVYEQKNN